MHRDSAYAHAIDRQLSELTGGDLNFKSELVAIYVRYMQDIKQEFAQLMHQRDQTGMRLLQHKHKTTCHVLALPELTEAFEQAKVALASGRTEADSVDVLIKKVIRICNAALHQLGRI